MTQNTVPKLAAKTRDIDSYNQTLLFRIDFPARAVCKKQKRGTFDAR